MEFKYNYMKNKYKNKLFKMKYKEKFQPKFVLLERFSIDENFYNLFSCGCDPKKCKIARCCKLKIPVNMEEIEKIQPLIDKLCLEKEKKEELKRGISTNTRYIKKFNDNCIFAYFLKEDDVVLCSLYTYCLENNLYPKQILPEACVKFPILYNGSSLTFSDRNIKEFPCMNLSKNVGKIPLIAFKENIIKYIGKDVYDSLLKKQKGEYFEQFF